MTTTNQNALQELMDVEDAIRPVIVTISHEDNPNPEGPMLVGFRIRSWGSYYQAIPKVCWMETSGRHISCDVVDVDDMDAAHMTALMAITDQIADNIPGVEHYRIWN